MATRHARKREIGDDTVEIARLPPIHPEWLGSARFRDAHGVRFAYVAGEMARGISSVTLVVAMAEAGMLAFFGAAGLPIATVDAAIERIGARLGPDGLSWGINLMNTQAPGSDDALIDLFLARKVRRVSASAFMTLSPAVVRYAFAGARRRGDGAVTRPNHLFAKVSRAEVARHFMSPPPAAMLRDLVAAGKLTAEEAALASELPVAEDVTGEADSGGHTDNRPLGTLLPTLMRLRRETARHAPACGGVRIGAAGGIGTPEAVAGAFAMGADYVMTGSINQSARESGLSKLGRAMLAEAGVADVAMAPSADMFEAGARVQVLARGTMFAARARKLQEIHRTHESLSALAPATRAQLERDVFRRPLDAVVDAVRAYFADRDPAELKRFDADQRHAMALVFRWYLGLSSQWAIEGETGRRADFQIWCGPAMGAFNDWVAGSVLARPDDRGVVEIALNLLEGAACLTRMRQLRSAGVEGAAEDWDYRPRPLSGDPGHGHDGPEQEEA